MKRSRPMGVRRQRRSLVMVATLVLLSVVSACSGSESDAVPAGPGSTATGRPTTTTTVADTTTATEPNPRSTGDTSPSAAPDTSSSGVDDQVIVDRYIGYWQARFAANSGVPNPDDPRLAEFATGRQLEQVRSETKSNLDDGLSFRSATQPANLQRVTVVSVDGDHAVVQECVVSDDVAFKRDSGEVTNDSVMTYNARGEMLREDGVWRVSAVTLVQKWAGLAGCALESR